MALKDTINNDLKAALLSGNHFATQVLRGLKAVILNEEVAKGLREVGLDDASIEQLLAREVKKRNESATLYDAAGRQQLAVDERAEADIISVYLPKQLSEQEIEVSVKRVINDLGATEMKQMGQVIGKVKQELGNAADGSIVSRLVKEALSQ